MHGAGGVKMETFIVNTVQKCMLTNTAFNKCSCYIDVNLFFFCPAPSPGL